MRIKYLPWVDKVAFYLRVRLKVITGELALSGVEFNRNEHCLGGVYRLIFTGVGTEVSTSVLHEYEPLFERVTNFQRRILKKS